MFSGSVSRSSGGQQAVDEAEDDRDDEGRAEAVDGHAGQDSGGDEHGDGADQDVREDSHGPQSIHERQAASKADP